MLSQKESGMGVCRFQGFQDSSFPRMGSLRFYGTRPYLMGTHLSIVQPLLPKTRLPLVTRSPGAMFKPGGIKMKKIVVTSLVSLLLATGLRTQQHAPTADVCRADRAFWDIKQERMDYFNQATRQIDDNTIQNNNPVAKMPFKEINLRMREMSVCLSVDEQNALKYSNLADFYSSVQKDRYRRFIQRHDLMAQFFDEDAAGMR
jgi:hypothetical protein